MMKVRFTELGPGGKPTPAGAFVYENGQYRVESPDPQTGSGLHLLLNEPIRGIQGDRMLDRFLTKDDGPLFMENLHFHYRSPYFFASKPE